MIKLLFEKNYQKLSRVTVFDDINKRDGIGNALLDMILMYDESIHNKKVMIKYFLDHGAKIRSRHLQMLLADQD